MIYDTRGVFDGTIIPKGFNGFPTIFYTSTFTGPLGAVEPEEEGTETQSMGPFPRSCCCNEADEPCSLLGERRRVLDQASLRRWRQSHHLQMANAESQFVIFHACTFLDPDDLDAAGFRDPFVFNSPKLAGLLANSTVANSTVANSTTATSANSTTVPTSNLFATVSGGVRGVGSKLFLYRQATVGDFIDWKYIGPLFETALNQSYSIWSGSTFTLSAV